jgi:hypothetical protein
MKTDLGRPFQPESARTAARTVYDVCVGSRTRHPGESRCRSTFQGRSSSLDKRIPYIPDAAVQYEECLG